MEVVVVDDELVSLTVLKQLVDKLPDCRAEGFTDAAAALSYCEDHDTDLVIVDYMMPELNGIEFTRRFRTLRAQNEVPVLMVTASGDREVRDSALQAGVNDFLNKPFDFVELQARAANMLALRASHKKLTQSNVSSRKARQPSTAYIPDANVLDLNLTRARLAADEALLTEVATIFTRTAPGLLSAISASLSANELARAYGHAHSLKGAVAAFEAPEVFNSLAHLEAHAKKQDAQAATAAFALARTLVERLVSELAPVVQNSAEQGAGAMENEADVISGIRKGV
jgi:DNA-binding response OmpR family regulator